MLKFYEVNQFQRSESTVFELVFPDIEDNLLGSSESFESSAALACARSGLSASRRLVSLALSRLFIFYIFSTVLLSKIIVVIVYL